MKALETIKKHIEDLKRMEDVFTFYGCFSSASECKKANKELIEAIAELEAFQSRTCKTCKNFYRHDNSLSHGCLRGYSTHIMYGIPCVYVDYGCIRHEPKEIK